LRDELGCGESKQVTALSASAVAVTVTQTTFVCVAAVEMVTSIVEKVVDLSISAITTVARWVAIRVTV
jgi:ABC-type xylose transport system permease subunit